MNPSVDEQLPLDPVMQLPRVARVCEDFPDELVPTKALNQLSRFYLDLDAIGRLDADTLQPKVDEITLLAMLREFVGRETAEHLLEALQNISASSFRGAHEAQPSIETSWFGLADKIVIFDGSPEARFAQLRIPLDPTPRLVVQAVHRRFPSLEEEMLTADLLPRKIVDLIASEERFRAVLGAIAKQLGWWSALVAILLICPAVVTRSDFGSLTKSATIDNAWPLSMFVLAAAVGGWTLTVVGSLILAPID